MLNLKSNTLTLFLILLFISPAIFAQGQTPATPPSIGASVPQTSQQATPADIIKQRSASIQADIQKLRVCQAGAQNPGACNIDTKKFLDFAIYLGSCPQLKNWTVNYPTPGGFTFSLSSTLSGFCQLTVNFGALNLPSKTCILTQEQANLVASPASLQALYEYDTGQVTGKEVDHYIKPITDCLGPPPGKYEGTRQYN